MDAGPTAPTDGGDAGLDGDCGGRSTAGATTCGTWTDLGVVPEEALGGAALVLDQHSFVVGGSAYDGRSSNHGSTSMFFISSTCGAVQIQDASPMPFPQNGTWTWLPSGRTALVGGELQSNDGLGGILSVSSWDPSDGGWTGRPPLTVGRNRPSVAVGAEGTIVAVGGIDDYDHPSTLGSIEMLTPDSGEWAVVVGDPDLEFWGDPSGGSVVDGNVLRTGAYRLDDDDAGWVATTVDLRKGTLTFGPALAAGHTPGTVYVQGDYTVVTAFWAPTSEGELGWYDRRTERWSELRWPAGFWWAGLVWLNDHEVLVFRNPSPDADALPAGVSVAERVDLSTGEHAPIAAPMYGLRIGRVLRLGDGTLIVIEWDSNNTRSPPGQVVAEAMLPCP